MMRKDAERRFKMWDIIGRPADVAGAASMSSKSLTVADPKIGDRTRLRRDRAILESTSSEPPTSFEFFPPLVLQLDGACHLYGMGALKCRTKSISPTTALLTRDAGHSTEHLTGRRTDLHLDHIGTVSGVISSQDKDEFAVAIDESCRETVRRQLSQLAKDSHIAFDETSKKLSVTRLEPETRNCVFSDEDGIAKKGKIVNFSQVDILVRTAIIPARHHHITFQGPQRRLATVVHSFETGFTATFCTPIPASIFSAALKFIDA